MLSLRIRDANHSQLKTKLFQILSIYCVTRGKYFSDFGFPPQKITLDWCPLLTLQQVFGEYNRRGKTKEGKDPAHKALDWQAAVKSSQSGAPTSVTSGNFLEIQILEPYCRHPATEIQRVYTSLLPNKSARTAGRKLTWLYAQSRTRLKWLSNSSIVVSALVRINYTNSSILGLLNHDKFIIYESWFLFLQWTLFSYQRNYPVIHRNRCQWFMHMSDERLLL